MVALIPAPIIFIILWTRNRKMETLVSTCACLSKINWNRKVSKIWDFSWSATYALPLVVLNHTIGFRSVTRNEIIEVANQHFFNIFTLENIQRDSIAGILNKLRAFLSSNSSVSNIFFLIYNESGPGMGPSGEGGSFPGVNKPRREINHSPPFYV
jgi:hypothetical protein